MNETVRRALRTLSTILIVAGALLLLDAGLTLVWQEPVSAFVARRQQDRLGARLRVLDRAVPTPVQRRALASLPDVSGRMAFLARELERSTPEGDALGRIRVPRMGASFVLVNGTSRDDLTKGPGFYSQRPLPGVPGTSAIAGHRTTYLAPFRHIDRLRPGDPIYVEMPYGRFTYRVQRLRIVSPQALWVLNRVGYDRLVLTACHPLYSAAKRIVAFARLASVVPRGAAAVRSPGALAQRPATGA